MRFIRKVPTLYCSVTMPEATARYSASAAAAGDDVADAGVVAVVVVAYSVAEAAAPADVVVASVVAAVVFVFPSQRPLPKQYY